ncbi:MAG: ATP-binding protein [Bacteroidia bacterium]|nr:ATP-binding protein [Bacteroidia bacterium]
MIERRLTTTINDLLFKGKVIIILGPRQAGKTTLLNSFMRRNELPSIYFNGDDDTTVRLLSRAELEHLKMLFGGNKLVIVDEAQRIPNIGRTAKLIADSMKDVQLILSGSSAFEISQQMSEPLTGRKISMQLYPISFAEWESHVGYLGAEQMLEQRLVFGFYPEVIINPGNQENLLREIADSYLYKDVLIYGQLRKADAIRRLLQAIAFQLGSEVSYNELAKMCGLDLKTVERYVDILEQAFVVFRLGSFARNLRNELKKARKIYFYDNGIRNVIINQLQPFAVRRDQGALWENFLVSERLKRNAYADFHPNTFFWRTTMQQEIDYIEEINANIFAWEFKLNTEDKVRFPKTFLNTYPEGKTEVITRENFRRFVAT